MVIDTLSGLSVVQGPEVSFKQLSLCERQTCIAGAIRGQLEIALNILPLIAAGRRCLKTSQDQSCIACTKAREILQFDGNCQRRVDMPWPHRKSHTCRRAPTAGSHIPQSTYNARSLGSAFCRRSPSFSSTTFYREGGMDDKTSAPQNARISVGKSRKSAFQCRIHGKFCVRFDLSQSMFSFVVACNCERRTKPQPGSRGKCFRKESAIQFRHEQRLSYAEKVSTNILLVSLNG